MWIEVDVRTDLKSEFFGEKVKMKNISGGIRRPCRNKKIFFCKPALALGNSQFHPSRPNNKLEARLKWTKHGFIRFLQVFRCTLAWHFRAKKRGCHLTFLRFHLIQLVLFPNSNFLLSKQSKRKQSARKEEKVLNLVDQGRKYVGTGSKAPRQATKDASDGREEISAVEKAEIPTKRFPIQYAISIACIITARQRRKFQKELHKGGCKATRSAAHQK